MEYNVKHDEKRHRFEYDRNGLMAFVEYDLEDGVMDIFHTLVPIPMKVGSWIGFDEVRTGLLPGITIIV